MDNDRSFGSLVNNIHDFTQHDGVIYGLRKNALKVFAWNQEDGTRIAENDFDLDPANAAPQGISYDEGYLYVPDSGTLTVFAYTMQGVRDTAKEFALDPENTAPRGCDHYDDRIWITDKDAKRTFNYKRDGTRDPPNQIVLIDNNQKPVGFAFVDNKYKVLDGKTGRVEAYTKSGTYDMAGSFHAGIDLTGSANVPVLRGMTYRNMNWHIVYTQGSDIKLDILRPDGTTITHIYVLGSSGDDSHTQTPVSYTHLTLPTKA